MLQLIVICSAKKIGFMVIENVLVLSAMFDFNRRVVLEEYCVSLEKHISFEFLLHLISVRCILSDLHADFCVKIEQFLN